MEKIVEFIVCPVDKAPLMDKNEYWECTKCNAKYRVTNGIPNLIPEERITESETKNN